MKLDSNISMRKFIRQIGSIGVISTIIIVSVAVYIGCDPDTTHTMDEMLTEISKGIDYEGQAVTTEVTIEAIEKGTANEDKLYLVTNRSGYTFLSTII